MKQSRVYDYEAVEGLLEVPALLLPDGVTANGLRVLGSRDGCKFGG